MLHEADCIKYTSMSIDPCQQLDKDASILLCTVLDYLQPAFPGKITRAIDGTNIACYGRQHEERES